MNWSVAPMGVNGGKFTGSNGGIIFLPAAGGRLLNELYQVGSWGIYWSCSLDDGDFACRLSFNDGDVDNDHTLDPYHRYDGHSVRPVRNY